LEVNHMGKSHSVDLRQRVVAMVASGQSRRAAARHFGVSNSSAIKLLQRRERTGTIVPARQGRPPGSGKLSAYRDFLVAQVEEKPDITMPELARRLEKKHGLVAPPSSLSRFLILQGFTYKKTADGIGTRTR
jgi:transposase